MDTSPLTSPTLRVPVPETPQFRETMLDHSFNLLDPATQWPWIGIFLILISAVLSVSLILLVTRRAVRDMTNTTRQMMLEVDARVAATPAQPTALTSIGRGDVIWKSGGFTLGLVRRFANVMPDDLERAADEGISLLLSKLIGAGVDPRDIVESAPAMASTSIGIQMVSIHVRDPKLEGTITEAAFSAGYREEAGAARQEITIEDAHDTAGNRAVQDALENTTTLTASLRISREQMAMIGADIETVAIPGDDTRVVKVATTRWTHAARVEERAAA